MKRCPFCTSELPDEALKCKFCGEWVNATPQANEQHREQTLNVRWQASEAHMKMVKVMLIWMGVTSLAGFVFFFGVVYLFFLPEWNRMKDNREQFNKDIEQKQKNMPGR